MQTQELNFQVKLPISNKLLSEAERFTRLEAIVDVKKSSSDSARVTFYSLTAESEEISVNYHLKSFLQKPLQDLTYQSQVHVSVNEKLYLSDNTLIGSYSLPGFTGVNIFMKRTVTEGNSTLPSENSLNVLSESLPIFDYLKEKMNEKLLRIVGGHSLENWWKNYSGDMCTLHFTYIVNSGYDQANFYVFQAVQYSIQSYLVYFYKSLVLFASKLGNNKFSQRIIQKLQSLNSLREKTEKKTSPNDYLSLIPIADFSLLKGRTNFQSGISALQQAYTKPVVVTPVILTVVKEGVLYKRGEGPFDFNWNERKFVLDSLNLTYYKLDELEEPRGKLPIASAIVGDIAPYDGRNFALKIEWLDLARVIWLSSDDQQALIDWKMKLLKHSLSVFDAKDLEYFINKKDGGDKRMSEDVEKEAVKLRVSIDRQDSFHESGAEYLKNLTIEDIIFTEIGSEGQKWEFYKVKNRVRISILSSQIELINPRSKLIQHVKEWLPTAVYAVFCLIVLWLQLKVWLTVVFTLIPGSYLSLKKLRRKSKKPVSDYLFLRGQFFYRRPVKVIMDYAMNLKNLMVWNQEFSSVSIRSSNKFEAQLAKNNVLFGEVHGEIKFSKNAFMINVKNLPGTYNTSEFFVFEETPELPETCMLTCTMKVHVSDKNLSFKQVLKQFESQFYSLTKLKDAVGGAALQAAKPHRIAETIHPDENGTFFTRGKPFMEQGVQEFQSSIDLVSKMLMQTSSEQQNLGEVPAVVVAEGVNKRPQSRGKTSIKKELFLHYFDYFAAAKTNSLSRMIFPVSESDKRSFFSQITAAWSYLPVYLPMAAAANLPEEKVKLVLCFALAGLSQIKIAERMPNFPYVGETYQGFLSDGSSVNWEQIDEDHSCFYIQDVQQRFYVHGSLGFRLSFADNHISIDVLGELFVEFGSQRPNPKLSSQRRGSVSSQLYMTPQKAKFDANSSFGPLNDVISVKYPRINVSGLVVANFDMTLQGSMQVEYRSKNIAAHVEFDRIDEPDQVRQRLSGKLKTITDQKVLSVIGGLYPHFISFDNFCYWKSELVSAARLHSANRLLPSDSTLREDIYNMNKEKEASSQFTRINVAINNHMIKLLRNKAQPLAEDSLFA